MTDEQFAELSSSIDRLTARSLAVPKRGPDWSRIIGIALTVGVIAGSVLAGYIFQTKAEAAQHENYAERTFETKTDAKDIRKTLSRKIDAIQRNTYEAALRSGVPRRKLDTGVDDDGK